MTRPHVIASVGLAGLAAVAVTGQDWLLVWLLAIVALLAISGLAWQARTR